VSFAVFLNHWWNLPFLVMLGLCGVFFVLQAIGILGASADSDADVDHAPDVDADAAWHDPLAFLGVGRVPFMVVWVTLFLFAGFSGIFINRVLFVRAEGDYRGWWLILVSLVALLVGLAGVRIFSRLAARLVDVGGRGATAKHELTGKIGVVASPVLDSRFGEIRVRDDRGDELLLHGCLRDGEAPLARGAKVVLVSYDGDKQLFWAAACPEIEEQERRG